MADHRQQGEGEHDQRDMAVPTVPGAGLVVGETEFGLRRLEGVLDRPTAPFNAGQRLDRRPLGAPRREERQASIGEMAPDQQAARPWAVLPR
jgi:hypothetical protein